MSSRVWCRLAAAVGGVLASVVLAGPAQALPMPEIPPDVAAVLAGPALHQAQAGDAGVSADFSGAVRVDDVHEVFRYSPDFVDGIPTTEPVTSSGEWLAAITRGDQVLGTVRASKEQGGAATPAGFSDDVVLGAALGTVSATELLVVDEPNGGYYALDGTIVRPLNEWARRVLPEPKSLSDVQDAIAGQYALSRAQPEDAIGPSMLPVSLGAMVVALVIGAMAFLRRRNRYGRLAP